EGLLRYLTSQLIVSPLRRAHPELELPGVDPWEELATQISAHDGHHRACRDQINEHDDAAVGNGPGDQAFVAILQPREETWSAGRGVRVVAVLEHPNTKDRHERARKKV